MKRPLSLSGASAAPCTCHAGLAPEPSAACGRAGLPGRADALEVEVLRAVLDRLGIAIAVVAEHGRILYVNEAAHGMLRDGANLRSSNGRLTGTSRKAALELQCALRLVQAAGAALDDAGIGVALPGSDGCLAIAHVVPLMPAPGRPGSRHPGARAAAVLVSRAAAHAQPDLAVIARSYRLTPAEVRLLDRLLVGETVSEAATALEVSVCTARSHLKRVFAKTGALRQADLLALVHRLAPPTLARRGPLGGKRPPTSG